MKNFIFPCLFFLFISCSNEEKKILAEKEKIKQVFSEYQAAISNSDGNKVAALMDSKTLEWYDKIKRYALESKKEELEQKNFMTKMIVLALRQNFSLSEIEGMDAKKVLAYNFDKASLMQRMISQYEIVGIEVENDKAAAALGIKNKPTGIAFMFVKENDAWKINIASIINLANQLFKGSIERENERVLKFVKSTSPNPINENIWEPLKK